MFCSLHMAIVWTVYTDKKEHSLPNHSSACRVLLTIWTTQVCLVVADDRWGLLDLVYMLNKREISTHRPLPIRLDEA